MDRAVTSLEMVGAMTGGVRLQMETSLEKLSVYHIMIYHGTIAIK